MNKQELLQVYAADERLKSIASALNPSAPLLAEGKGNSLHIRLEGLIGASSSVVAASLYQLLNSDGTSGRTSMLFVLNDKDEAAYFQNDLQHFIEKKEVQLLSLP